MSCAKRSLRIEPLESKQLLAGDVAVNVLHGVLTLQGDELANQVVVSSGEEPGSYVIRGLEGTQLVLGDAEPATEVVVKGVRHGLRADLGEGNDVLRVANATIRGNVAINMGAGADRVAIGVLPEATANEEDAAATLVPNVKLGASAVINTQDGSDTVTIVDTVARGALLVSTGADDDVVRLGRQEESPADAVAEADTEPVRPDVSFARGVRVALGAGDDVLVAKHLRAGGLGLHADGGLGADTVRVAGVQTPVLSISGGRGDDVDRVTVHDTATRLLAVNLGGGDDTLTLGGVKAHLALLQGGPGEADTLTLLGENMIRHRRVAGFEIRNPSEEAGSVA